MSDDSLWSRITEGDGTAIVGLKVPGANRGEYNGRILITSDQRRLAEETVASLPGVVVLRRHERLPFVRLKIPNLAVLRDLRRLPVVDYVEPALVRRGFQLSSGCSKDSYSSGLVSSTSGDAVPHAYAYMGVPQAWHRASGDNITIGFIDTGIYGSSQQMVGAFTAGMSGDRWVQYRYVEPYSSGLIGDGDCSHGTRAASAATAPRDGSGPVGVAWKANLVSIRFDGDVASIDINPTVDAIYLAGSTSNVVGMAWGSTDWFNSVEGAIKDVYYNSRVLFIGAAGTSPCLSPSHNYVFFPARMGEVVAVTASGATSGVDCDSHYGPEVELTAAVRTTTAGPNSDVLNMQASSNATALIAGAAAVVWQYLGGWNVATRSQVMQRLYETASSYSNPDPDLGYGQINVARAVGAMWYVNLSGCDSQTENCTFHYKLDQCVVKTYSLSYRGGTGPYTYSWSNGDTGSSTTMQLCPEPYQEVRYALTGSVTDQSDGNRVSRSLDIRVTHSNPDYACETCPK